MEYCHKTPLHPFFNSQTMKYQMQFLNVKDYKIIKIIKIITVNPIKLEETRITNL